MTKKELDSIIARDPSARSRLEVMLCYPSFHVLLIYRVSHWLWQQDFGLLARMLSGFGRLITGIEIHPAARIGKRLFIDHGMGVVIGETADIGNDVTLYQGVTLGGVLPAENSDDQRKKKRHPTIEDNVIIGSGAQILGPITLGINARVGANAVVTRDVSPGATVVGVPAKPLNLFMHQKATCFTSYGMPPDGMMTDPLATQMEIMQNELAELKKRLTLLEQQTKTLDEVPSKQRGGDWA